MSVALRNLYFGNYQHSEGESKKTLHKANIGRLSKRMRISAVSGRGSGVHQAAGAFCGSVQLRSYRWLGRVGPGWGCHINKAVEWCCEH